MNDIFPQEFLRRLEQLHIDPSVFTPRPTTFRINAIKTKNKTFDFETAEVNWYTDAFILKNKTLRDLTETDIYKNGEIYVQSLSSMIPPLVMDPKPGEKILDITAAPGSKTTQIAAIMGNRGEIVANDAGHERMYRLKANLSMQGVTIARVIKNDARGVWQQFPEYFDKVLVDVPCSMEGRFLASDPKTYQDWSVKKVKELAQLQKWILRSAVSATKPGGTIVYSTCTLSPEENEEVIDWIVKKEKGKIELVDISIKNLATHPGIIEWGTKQYDESIKKTLRIYPSATMEGFFVAKIKKITSTVSAHY